MKKNTTIDAVEPVEAGERHDENRELAGRNQEPQQRADGRREHLEQARDDDTAGQRPDRPEENHDADQEGEQEPAPEPERHDGGDDENDGEDAGDDGAREAVEPQKRTQSVHGSSSFVLMTCI